MPGIGVSDVCDRNPKITLVSITSNEPGAGQDIQGAVLGIDDRNFLLRAQRNGTGTGRVYTVRYRATDASGNATFTHWGRPGSSRSEVNCEWQDVLHGTHGLTMFGESPDPWHRILLYARR